jgi:hypothetical protein
MMTNCHHGCCVALHLKEDNVRLVLIFAILMSYMLITAAVLSAIERPTERTRRQSYNNVWQDFIAKNPTINRTDLYGLMNAYADASMSGLIGDKRARWDFLGAFFYGWTVFATVGQLTHAITDFIVYMQSLSLIESDHCTILGNCSRFAYCMGIISHSVTAS